MYVCLMILSSRKQRILQFGAGAHVIEAGKLRISGIFPRCCSTQVASIPPVYRLALTTEQRYARANAWLSRSFILANLCRLPSCKLTDLKRLKNPYQAGPGASPEELRMRMSRTGPLDQILLFGDSITEQSASQQRGFAFMPALQDGIVSCQTRRRA